MTNNKKHITDDTSVLKTSTLYIDVSNEVPTETPELDLPVFSDMTKIELWDWAYQNMSLKLDFRHKKEQMIETIKKHL